MHNPINLFYPSQVNPIGNHLLLILTPIKQLIQHIRSFNQLKAQPTDRNNLQPQHRIALAQLKRNRDIIIKPADKGSAIVILDKQQYILEAHRQLDNHEHYAQISHSLQMETQTWLFRIFTSLKQKGYITNK